MTSLRGAPATGAAGLRIYSPAPPDGPLHALNRHLQAAAADWPGLPNIETVAIALPESINGIVRSQADRSRHLPIVTSVDFELARLGTGPAWHGYDRASPDLKFVATLYDVGFGIQVRPGTHAVPEALRGRRIAAPARPSAVRLLTEVLLHDGWNILGDVDLVDATPQAACAAFLSGEVDAISWNLVLPGAAGCAQMLPVQGSYIAVDRQALARINAANAFTLGLAHYLAGVPPLLSFGQALAAWDCSDDGLVTELLACIAARGPLYPGLPGSLAAITRWPGLDSSNVHRAALRFFRDRGLSAG